ncbi:zf-DHHC-domain-containing protein [Cryphonectria parasitica EP155]|uniref:Palmitoyltransferase PFA4 n=1 Tax=Cryphonectria parasitica (strain ATCC 38755 / EP155) TaxID=660469 RepID=A0A9P4Y1B0_CRYP1|nr:zf-DHHC-domain-containing protein [Cryphonectria parasitica EP155]KAF3764605.1 zf-DHHC-domain-containing protein [Cryphonectria parasitica EP155]
MAGILTGPASNSLQRLFIPAACVFIFFLGYTSQWLFNTAEYLEPGPMTQRETAIFNVLLVCLWLTYYKSCTVPPGQYTFPPPQSNDDDDKKDNIEPSSTTASSTTKQSPKQSTTPARWCKKCAAPKPLRAHHCRHCGTCIPKMDHHCPWTGNCVSLQTFPHFFRLLVYANLALAYLHCILLYPRFRALFWDDSSRLPAYLGPSIPAMVHLTLLGLLGGLASLGMGVLLITTARSWVLNQTMIEGWEVERHEAVLLRAKKGGWWAGDGGTTTPALRIDRVEFPYDLGFFANMAQAMGTRNILSWLDPLVGGGPTVSAEVGKGTGWEWEENGFNDRVGMWPPPDPDKMRRSGPAGSTWPGAAAVSRAEIESIDHKWKNPQEEVAVFRARQEMDLRRRRGESGVIAELNEGEELEDLDYEYVESDEPGWTNSEGDRLRDYGVDEDAEEDDEDVPLGELLRRRKAYDNSEA